MRLRIVAIGRLRKGPASELCQDYLTRFARAGRSMGLGPAEIIELEDRTNSGSAAESRLIERVLPDRGRICVLDERGKAMTSPQFAGVLRGWRDEGEPEICFVIGGADGIDGALRNRADQVISFGSMVWPHKLARVMLTEQIYRASQILAGAPYHRE